MKKKLTTLLLVVATMVLLIAGKTSASSIMESNIKTENLKNKEMSTSVKKSVNEIQDTAMITLNIQVENKTFIAKLFNNASTQTLIAQMPMTLPMSELNSNEKYYYLPDILPTDSQRVENINAGDLMLYGSNCLVLFYESFSTFYSYTKLGFVEDVSGLADALGSSSVQVTFALVDTVEMFRVTYDSNGATGTVPTDTDKAAGTKFTIKGNTMTVPSGKQFNGWNTAVDGSGTPYAAGAVMTMPSHNVILYAQWIDIPVITYTVTFKNGYDNTPLKEKTVEHDKDATPPSNPERIGYEFDGWDVSYKNITTDTIVTAKWKIKTYNVIFKHGTKVLTTLMSQMITYNNKAVQPTKNPTKNGYTFIGWYTSSVYTRQFDFTNKNILKDTSVYVYFVKNYSKPTRFKVTKVKAERVKINWVKKSGYSYKILWSIHKSKNFKKLNNASKGSFFKSDLKKGRKYYFKVRACKTVVGVKVYGKYTKVKYIKV